MFRACISPNMVQHENAPPLSNINRPPSTMKARTGSMTRFMSSSEEILSALKSANALKNLPRNIVIAGSTTPLATEKQIAGNKTRRWLVREKLNRTFQGVLLSCWPAADPSTFGASFCMPHLRGLERYHSRYRKSGIYQTVPMLWTRNYRRK